MKARKSEFGFSLVELMVVISIGTVLMLGLMAFMTASNQQMQTDEVNMTISESAREGLYKMNQELRKSAPDRVTITGGGSVIQFDIPSDANPVNTNFADTVDNYSVEWSSADTIQYALAGGQLIRTDIGTGASRVIMNDVTGITFTGNAGSPTLVTTNVSVQRALLNGRLIPETPLQLTARAEVRNA